MTEPTRPTKEKFHVIAARQMAVRVCRMIGGRGLTPAAVLGECWLEVRLRLERQPDLHFNPTAVNWGALDVARRLTGRAFLSMKVKMRAEIDNPEVRARRRPIPVGLTCRPQRNPMDVWADYADRRKALPIILRVVLYLYTIEGMTLQEIADATGRTQSGISRLLKYHLGASMFPGGRGRPNRRAVP